MAAGTQQGGIGGEHYSIPGLAIRANDCGGAAADVTLKLGHK